MKFLPMSLLRRCSLVVFALLAGRLAAATDDWSFTVSPYLWVASVKVDSSLPDLPPATPPEVERFETKITGGFMIGAQVQHGAFGLWVDYDWLRLNTNSTNPAPAFGSGELTTNFYHTTAALTWRMPSDASWRVDLLGGVRYFSLSGEQVFTAGILPGFTRSADHSVSDAVFGASVSHDLDERWFLTGKILVGGLFSDSNSMADGFAAVGYHFDQHWSGVLGYRYLREDFKESRFSWKLTGHGAVLGFSYHF